MNQDAAKSITNTVKIGAIYGRSLPESGLFHDSIVILFNNSFRNRSSSLV